MSEIVIAVYRPKEGREEALANLVRDHVPKLRSLGYATDREPLIMRSKDGTVLEVFEWRSREAIQQAHHDSVVLAMWDRFAATCTYESLAALEESKEPFAEFTPL